MVTAVGPKQQWENYPQPEGTGKRPSHSPGRELNWAPTTQSPDGDSVWESLFEFPGASDQQD